MLMVHSAMAAMTGAGLSGSPVGQQLFTESGTFVVPAGVTSICAVAISPGGQMNSGTTGFGGALRYVNDIAVDEGEPLSAQVFMAASPYSRLLRNTAVLVSAIGQNGGVGAGFNGGSGVGGASYPRAGAGAAGFISAGQNATTGTPTGGGGGTDPRQANAPGALKGTSPLGYGQGGDFGGGAGRWNNGGIASNGQQGRGCLYIVWGPDRAFPGNNIGEL